MGDFLGDNLGFVRFCSILRFMGRWIKYGTCIECGNHFSYSRTSQLDQQHCSRTCFATRYRRLHIIPKIEAGLIKERRYLKRYLIEQRGHVCEYCHCTEWLGRPIPLEVDHVNGDASNNLPSNLRLLCPNCHALTPTAKGRNRGKGRKSRGVQVN